MNRFRTKKKAKADVAQETEAPSPFRPFRKGKKHQEEEKVEVDISAALPSSDDFRTSLLMTGLSARFSMLREQDDPSSKLGKASDDSVLSPKRQSRMDYGAFRGLGDIAEVESIKAPRPFARMDSYASSDDADSTTAGSVMGRSKPTEGNNLFGGRQKIYKIPTGTNSSKALAGGMSTRILYDDDVAMSAFQKWRMTEKGQQKSSEDEGDDTGERLSEEVEADAPRSESPFPADYNRKRETSSTASSVPYMARNSTAATSVTSSQPAPSLKDGQPSNGSTPASDRGVTRTRRLYETGLNHDLHEHQSSVLTRVDTLTRQRAFGTRTPDLVGNSPSPTATGFVERFSLERRVLAKGSAPNLRSMSPPITASSAGTPDLGIRAGSAGDSRSNFGGVPPLSPPISEADEHSMLSIGPMDRGKATALGVFQKPSQPYDESRFAQRQLQLQQGRETPTQRVRDEPDTVSTRSRSSSSAGRQPLESRAEHSFTATQPSLKEVSTFLADTDSEASPAVSPKPAATSPQVTLRRPSDHQHPALRNSTLPTALSFASKSEGEPLPITEDHPSVTANSTEEAPSVAPNSKDTSPVDSPTLGPTSGAGLSGMVRQHLRGDSNASSIYGGMPPTAGRESRFPADSDDVRPLQDYGSDSNPWSMQDQEGDWSLDLDVNEPAPDIDHPAALTPGADQTKVAGSASMSTQRQSRDEFASQLADGARRVRERLTTYADPETRFTSTYPSGAQKDSIDLPPSQRPTGLGSAGPTSRGSSIDRGRAQSQSKAMKMLGLGGSGSSQASPTRESTRGEVEKDQPSPALDEEDQANAGGQQPSAGLRAFRQARRELQRHKELETKARHQQQQQQAPDGPLPRGPSPRSTPTKERPSRQETSSRERKPPPVFYQQRMPSEDSKHGNAYSGSREPSRADRDRSGSDSSNGGRSGSRPARSRNGPAPRENLQLGTNGTAPRPKLRSPGLPGTDIRRSPIMPPQPHPNAMAKMNQSNFASNGNLRTQQPRSYESGQPSPISPMPSPFMNSAPATPAAMSSPHRPSAPQSQSFDNAAPNVPLNDAMKRKVKTKDISTPTFVMSTSRVPTVSLPAEAAGNRSRSNSRSAPPLPPINPRRKQDSSKTRTVFESLTRRKGSTDEAASASAPNLPLNNSANSVKRVSRDEDHPQPEPRQLRKVATDGPNMNSRMRGNSPPVNVGPPASRMVVAQGKPRPDMGIPGGMI